MKHSCSVCGRRFAAIRIVNYTLWHEQVCRSCYYWARDMVYGAMTGNQTIHAMHTPWPHGIFLESPYAS